MRRCIIRWTTVLGVSEEAWTETKLSQAVGTVNGSSPQGRGSSVRILCEVSRVPASWWGQLEMVKEGFPGGDASQVLTISTQCGPTKCPQLCCLSSSRTGCWLCTKQPSPLDCPITQSCCGSNLFPHTDLTLNPKSLHLSCSPGGGRALGELSEVLPCSLLGTGPDVLAAQ